MKFLAAFCSLAFVCVLSSQACWAQLDPKLDTFNRFFPTATAGDGDLSDEDATAVFDYILGGGQTSTALLPAGNFAIKMDVNLNGNVGFDDAIAVATALLTYPFQNQSSAAGPADVNNSGSVTALDYLICINRIGQRGPDGNYKTTIKLVTPSQNLFYDVNGNNLFTSLDLVIVANSL